MRYWLHAAAWLAATFVVLELAARLVLGVSPRVRFDPRYDRVYEPGQLQVQSTEGFSRSRANELGNLDAPMPHPLPADGILVVGDSYTEGVQVAMDERFTDRLGAQLHRRVYNVGHSGWSPINALAFVEAEQATFAPTTVIVQISGNDFKDIVSPKVPHLAGAGARDPHAIVVPDRGKRGLGKYVTTARETASRSAIVGDLIVGALTVLRGPEGDGAGTGAGACDKLDPETSAGMEWLIGQLALAHRDVRLLYLPTLDYHGGCVDTCRPARDLYARAAAADHVRFVDVTDAVCARFAEIRQPLNGFWNTVPGTGHFNAEGHAVIAGVLAHELTDHPSAP